MKNSPGYIMVTSVIIAAVLLICLSVFLSFLNYSNSTDLLSFEFKQNSTELAYSCFQNIVAKVKDNPFYNPGLGGECVYVKHGFCKILSVANGAGALQAVYGNAFTNINFGFDSNFKITAWDEVPSVLTPKCE